MYPVSAALRSVVLLSLFALLTAGNASLCAQTDGKKNVSLHGQATLTGDFYGLESNSPDPLDPRRPSSLVRLVFTPELSWGDLKLPLTLVLSTEQTNVTTPQAPDQSLTQYLQNPMNRLSFSPQYKWARLDLGTYVPRYSRLTTGSLQSFGAGVDLRPGVFRLALFTGTSQRAIEPDSANGIVGAYARRTLAGRIAVGSEQRTIIGLNAIRSADDTTSISPQRRGGLVPQEGITGSIDMSVRMGERVTLKGEIAGSVFSRNLRSREVDDAEFVSGIMTVRESTRLDLGAFAEADYNDKAWGVTARADYLGDGFVPLGYPYAQTDLIEFSISPRARLINERLLLNGSLGYRVNNLQGTNLATSNQIVGTVNATGRIGEKLTVSANYSNFGFESAYDQDTLKIRTVTQNFGLTPALMLRGTAATHTLSLSFGLSDFTEENTLTSTLSVNDMISLIGSWSVALESIPLSGSASASYVRNNLALGALTIVAGSLGGSYRLMKGDLTPSLRLSWSRNGIGDADPDNQLGARLGLAWRVVDPVTLDVSGSVTRHAYGTIRPGVSYTEYLLRSGISTRF